MITQFSIQNYRSINDLMVIDFTNKGYTPSKNILSNLVNKQNEESIMRLNFFYGKNGAGKSTIVMALKALRQLALTSKNNSDYDVRNSRFFYPNIIPFKLSKSINPNTFFSLEFYYSNEKYRYSVLYNTNQKTIEDESLELIGSEEFVIFSRSNHFFMDLSHIELDRLSTYKIDRISILSVLFNFINIKSTKLSRHIRNVTSFFSSISFGFDNISDDTSLSALINNNEAISKLKNLLKSFDLSIDDIKVTSKNISLEEYMSRYSFLKDKMDSDFIDMIKDQYELNKVEYFLHFIHKTSPLSFDEESDGTQVIANILFSLISSNKKIWIIDDFENDLHLEAAHEFIKYIANNFFDMQFLFITHELNILNIDEVHHKAVHYFVERDNNSLSTDVVYLTRFKDLRTDDRNSWYDFYKKYRLGQYPSIKLNKIPNLIGE